MKPAARLLTALPALLVAGLTLSAPSAAQAAERFAVVSIANETKATMTVQYKWGNEGWKKKTLAPGARDWFSLRYAHANEDRSPEFRIRFDSDATSGRYNQEYVLKRHAAPEQNYDLGHKYAFRYDGPSHRYIDLYDAER